LLIIISKEEDMTIFRKSLIGLGFAVAGLSAAIIITIFSFMDTLYYEINMRCLVEASEALFTAAGSNRLLEYFSAETDMTVSLSPEEEFYYAGAKETYRLTLIASDGEVLWDSNVKDPMPNHSDRPEVMIAVTGSLGTAIRVSASTGVRQMYSAVPVFNSNQNVVGIFRLSNNVASFQQRISQAGPSFIVLAVVMLLVVAGAAFFVSRFIKTFVGNTVILLKKVSEGDLTQSLKITSKDELGDLARYINQALEIIKNLVINIKKEALILSDTGDDLASNMTETAMAINEITANIQSIKNRIINQSASINETHATMEQVVVNINKLDGLVENQSANITHVSSAVEEMAANIQSVTGTLANNANDMKTLREASEVGRTGLQEVATDIQGIAYESEGLMEINSVMQNIASQTNLLSMNAAIEAAHAGEAGKGFAVVADEIRKLAESSSKQSKTISTVLKKITGSIGKITQSTKNVLAKFEAIDESIIVVSDQEEHIRHAMEEQEIGSKQIVDGATQVNQVTNQVRNSSREMLEGSTEVIRESTELGMETQAIASGINDMADRAEQINTAVNQVNEISSKNRKGINNLMKEVSRFKVE
jgi:methyl-accepting chemotaxis protein